MGREVSDGLILQIAVLFRHRGVSQVTLRVDGSFGPHIYLHFAFWVEA